MSERLNNHFDKVIHCVSFKISKGRFRVNRLVLDIRNIIHLGIRREEGARGKGRRAVQFRPDLFLELGEVKPMNYALRIKSVDWVGHIALGRQSRICLNLYRS